MVVVAQGQHQVERIGQGGLALQVGAELVEVVVPLVPAHDGAVGVGPRQQGVDSVGQALAPSKAGGVLRLEHVERGRVDDGIAGAQQIGSSRIVPVAEGLEEPVPVQQPQLCVVVLPVYRLRRPHAGQPDHVGHAVSRRQNGGQVVRRPPVQARFDAPGPGIVIARRQGGQIRSRLYRRLPQFPGLHFLGVGVLPLRTRVVLGRNLVSQSVSHRAGVAERGLAQAALPQPEVDAGALRCKRGTGDDVHDSVGAVGSVQGSPRPEHHLDAFDVVVGEGDEIEGVDPQGGHPGDAVVRQGEKGPGEHVVEAAHNRIAQRHSGLSEVHPRQVLDVIADAERRNVANLAALEDCNRGRCIEDLLLLAGGGNHDLPEIDGLLG